MTGKHLLHPFLTGAVGRRGLIGGLLEAATRVRRALAARIGRVGLLVALFFASGAHAQTVPAGSPDLGLVRPGIVEAVVRGPDNRVYVGGFFQLVGGVPRSYLARPTATGALDTTWAPVLSERVLAMVIDGGFLYVAGGFSVIDGVTRPGLARFDLSTGELDLSWDPQIEQNAGNQPPSVQALAIDGGYLYLSGQFERIAGQDAFGCARFALGTMAFDTGWIPDVRRSGGLVPSFIRSLEADGAGSIYIGGSFNSVGGTERDYIAKISTSTAGLDATWNPDPNQSITALKLHDGSLYVAGGFTQIGGGAKPGLAKIDPGGTGAGDAAWIGRPSGFGNVQSLQVEGDVLYAGGSFEGISGGPAPSLAALDLSDNGALLPVPFDFAPEPDLGSPVLELVLDGDSIFVAGAHAGSLADGNLSLARVNRFSGATDLSFTAQLGRPGSADAILELPDGSLIVGGQFLLSNGIDRRYLLRVNADGSLHEWNPSPDAAVTALAYLDESVYVAGKFEAIGGSSAVPHLAKFSLLSDRPDTSWVPAPNNDVVEMISHAGSIYVAGFFSTIGGQTRSILAKLESAGIGAADPVWDPTNEPALPFAMVTDGTHLYVGGIDSFNNRPVVQIDIATGTTNLDWQPDLSGLSGGQPIADALAVSPGHLYIGGLFEATGTNIRYLARFALTGAAVDSGWNPDANSRVLSLALGRDQGSLYAGGKFSRIGGAAHTRVASLSTGATAAADAQFNFGVGDAQAEDPTVILEGVSSIFVGGAFDDVSGLRREGFARLALIDAPLVVEDSAVLVLPVGDNADAVTHFKVSAVTGGELFLPGGEIEVKAGDFIEVKDGMEGLVWMPDAGAPTQEITVFSAVSDTDAGLGAASMTLALTGAADPAVFSFSEATYSEGEAAATVTLTVNYTGSTPASVDIDAAAGTAVPVVFTPAPIGDYFDPGTQTLNFSSSGSQLVSIPFFNDSDEEGDESFMAVLSNPTGGAMIGSPGKASVQILDNEIIGSIGSSLGIVSPSPATPAASLGVLGVNLANDGELGQWRLMGEVDWRDSFDDGGAAATDLTTGNYVVEFKPVDGLLEPLPVTVPIDGTDATPVTESASYAGISFFGSGVASLSASLAPESLANEPVEAARAQWRRQGEVTWRDSGDVIEGLTSGLYVVEFKPVAGSVTPASRLMSVQAGQVNTTTVVYLFETDLTGAAEPQALPFNPDFTDEPYLFNGQIHTGQGYGSGVVTKERTVLTAAHVLFDDTTLSYVKNVLWFYQRHRGTYDLPPQVPRGWYSFGGYASQRENDVENPAYGPGVGSPQSQNLDVAAMYFLDQAGRGGFGGYLSSNAQAANEWLISGRDKFIVGYPMEGIPAGDRGKMHATAVNNDNYLHLQNFVFRTNDVKTSPGNSGGPVYVRADNGNYYPAAVYLGGSGESIMRSIDDQVVDLMNRAETAGSGGGNSTGGGTAYNSPGATNDFFARGLLTARIVGAAKGGWRIVDADGSPLMPYADSEEVIAVPQGDLNIEFKQVSGFTRPSTKLATVYIAQTTTLEGCYTQDMDEWTQLHLTDEGVLVDNGPLDDFDSDNLVHLIERAFNLSPTVADNEVLTPGRGTKGLPLISIEDLGAGRRLTIDYLRLKSEVASDLVYEPNFSDSPDGPYAPSTQSATVTEIDDRWERVVVQDDFTTDERPTRYGRTVISLRAAP